MRVHPILDWSYDEIWEYLRHPSLTVGDSGVEWCDLYDYGSVLIDSMNAELHR